jgi:hypothetical protein
VINLMPPTVKQEILYARRNTRLRKWAVRLFSAALVVVGVVAVGQMYLQQSINTYSAQVKQGEQALKDQKLDETQKKVEELSDSLKLVTQVLQREILFSKLLVQIGGVLPNGSILTNLGIDKVQGGIELQADAVNYQTGTQVQLNLQDPENKIFDKADILNIQCDSTSSDPLKKQYPCLVQIKALFSKNNTFTTIKPGTSN